MPQTAVPTSTITTNNWSGNVNGANLHLDIDEGVGTSDDATSYIFVNTMTPGSYTSEVKFGSLTDPTINTGHILRCRAIRNNISPQTLGLSLYQGATLIYNTTFNPNMSYGTHEFTLSEAQASAITDYTDLRVRIQFSYTGGTGPFVSAVEFEIPDAGGGGGGGGATIITPQAFALFI